MPERDMNPQAGNARRFSIAADEGETIVDLILPDRLPGNRQPSQYRIVKKDISDRARNALFRGRTVIWINNYGIRLRGNFPVKTGGNRDDPFTDEVEGEQFIYEVIVQGPAPKDYPTLVYFDGTDVQPASATVDSSGAYHFNLAISDPPTGWGGGG